jgi:hypothetical protein
MTSLRLAVKISGLKDPVKMSSRGLQVSSIDFTVYLLLSVNYDSAG